MNKILLQSADCDILRKGQTKKWTFNNRHDNDKSRYSLFFACEDASYSALKHEGSGEKLYLRVLKAGIFVKAENLIISKRNKNFIVDRFGRSQPHK